jgi:hypothetical protein
VPSDPLVEERDPDGDLVSLEAIDRFAGGTFSQAASDISPRALLGPFWLHPAASPGEDRRRLRYCGYPTGCVKVRIWSSPSPSAAAKASLSTFPSTTVASPSDAAKR